MWLAGSLGRWLIGEELPSSRSIAAITNELFGLAGQVDSGLAVIEDRLGNARDHCQVVGQARASHTEILGGAADAGTSEADC